jgi:hypothetical protein
MAIAHVSDEISRWGLDQKLSFDPRTSQLKNYPGGQGSRSPNLNLSFQKLFSKSTHF